MSTSLRLAQSYPVQVKFGNEIIAFQAHLFRRRALPFEEIAFLFGKPRKVGDAGFSRSPC